MQSRWLFALLAVAPSDHARGVQLMAEGKFAEAVAAFRAAAEVEPNNAELHYNLALALWRTGDAHGAEIAAEKAATLSDGRLAALRDGILGNLKIDEAKTKLGGEQPDLQAALSSAQKARDHFMHGAASDGAPEELVRNLERALKLIAEIEKKIEEQKKNEDKDKKPDDKKDGDKKDGDKKPDDKKDGEKDDKSEGDKSDKKDEGKDKPDKKPPDKKPPDQEPKDQKDDKGKSSDDKDQQKQDQQPPGQGENKDKPEPKPEPKPQPKDEEPKDKKPKDKKADDAKKDGDPQAEQQQGQADDKPEPQPAQASDAKDGKDDKPQAQLGQPQPGRELSPEETKRLLDKLQVILQQKAELEKAQKAARPKVKKDW